MKISTEQVSELLNIGKKIIVNGAVVDKFIINQTFPFHFKCELSSIDSDDLIFLWEMRQSSKYRFRISLHFQDNDSKIGLFRIDYYASHKNPECCLTDLPEIFKPYVGKIFSNKDHHVHYHVDGYRSLAWAIPIEDSDFEIKDLNEDNFNEQMLSAVQAFAKKINIITNIKINSLLL